MHVIGMPKGTGRHRSRRLRKKLCVDEFAAFGFKLDFVLISPEADQNSFWDSFIEEVEAQDLQFGGAESGWIEQAKPGAVTEDSRRAIETWLSLRSDVKDVRVDEIVDLVYVVDV
jgi:uncharacterized protein YggL (DUF469 family)